MFLKIQNLFTPKPLLVSKAVGQMTVRQTSHTALTPIQTVRQIETARQSTDFPIVSYVERIGQMADNLLLEACKVEKGRPHLLRQVYNLLCLSPSGLFERISLPDSQSKEKKSPGQKLKKLSAKRVYLKNLLRLR